MNLKRLALAVLILASLAVVSHATGTASGDPCTSSGVVPPDGDSWLLVYTFVVNVQESPNGTPIYETREQFDGQRFGTEEAAYCGAQRVRMTGVVLPVHPRFGRESNVMPETITPMPSLFAYRHGIAGPR